MGEFVHRPYIPGETIAAIATPPGEGGIAIIRLSGKRALEVAEKVFSGPIKSYKSHTAHFGYVKDASGKKIDDSLTLVMLGKKSFTGEDTVEFQCHGGMIASKRVLDAVLKAGARLAGPGEFTLKAFMNGKLDLTQAEAIQQLIGAKNETAFELAGKHLEGRLSRKIEGFQKRITDLTAILEAWIDFPEEGLEFATFEEMEERLEALISEMESLHSTFQDGRRIHHGLSLCIVGCPNAGKSSLMNALLDKERAIVTPIAGTTRDTLEEDFLLRGLHFRLIDTAGMRETDEIVEKEGIRRSKKAMESADLILLVLDVSKKIELEEKQLLEAVPKNKSIVILNKIDLPHQKPFLEFPYQVSLSAKEGQGIEALKEAIDRLVWKEGAPPKEEVLLTSLRHREALFRAKEACKKVIKGLSEDVSPEFLTFDIRQALLELGTILGTNISEDVLSSIFSHFCIGK